MIFSPADVLLTRVYSPFPTENIHHYLVKLLSAYLGNIAMALIKVLRLHLITYNHYYYITSTPAEQI